MKTARAILQGMAISLAASPAFAAVSTHKVYNSGILVLMFLGFCALVVVSQLIPSMILLAGMVKEALSGLRKGETGSNG